ncbi:hypothetical protein [Pseudohongiella nitratireducens]|uniref:hypothetical protein n=1 Tax=Pseudohongiella nitratireducens TaxID=1768907 RepID=UPI0030EE550D|tara:strand:- start:19343 stop:19702 length:360 start_codon:yes stop_codon:yes gene_type:complete
MTSALLATFRLKNALLSCQLIAFYVIMQKKTVYIPRQGCLYLFALRYNTAIVAGWLQVEAQRLKYGTSLASTRSTIKLMKDDKPNKPKKFFGFEVSDTVTYIVIAVLFVIFIRQVWVLF